MKALHTVHIDHQAFKAKPTGKQPSLISNRITKGSITCSIEHLANQAASGHTFLPAHLEGGRANDNWVSQSVFAVDFDNAQTKRKMVENPITFDDVLTRLNEYGIDCSFAYSSFSNKPKWPKFRVVFAVENTVDNLKDRSRIETAIKLLFPEADSLEPARYFYGGKELLYSNYEYHLDVDKLIDSARFAASADAGTNYAKALDKIDKELAYKGELEGRPDIDDLVRNPNWKLLERIQIFKDFLDPNKKLLHPQLKGLATNLYLIEGGTELFHNRIDANSAYCQSKHSLIKYCRRYRYFPMSLKKYSPYPEDGKFINLIKACKGSSIIRHKNPNPLLKHPHPVECLRLSLKYRINEVCKRLKPVNIVVTPTGIGKTQEILKMDNCVLAFPTHKLKDEASARMETPHLTTPDDSSLPVDIRAQLAAYYSVGAHSKASNYLKQEAKKNDAVKQYRDASLAAYASMFQPVLTTHQKALNNEFSLGTIVFDEDPLHSILPIEKTSIADLKKLAAKVNYAPDKIKLTRLIDNLNSLVPGVCKKNETIVFGNYASIEKKVVTNSKDFSGSVLGFFNCDFYMLDGQDPDTIHFIRRHDLPDCPVIILSATADEFIYRKLFGGRLKFYNLGISEMMGSITQDTEHSMSRQSLASHLDTAAEKVGDNPVITFKDYKHNFPNAVDDIHFGNTAGYDSLKGKDLSVVGTPRPNPIQVTLIAACLGESFKSSEYEEFIEGNVIRNGVEFPCNYIYKNPVMQAVQLFLIESELRQSVGRARANITKASVHVLSNYPLPEASIIGVDYLTTVAN